MRKFLLQMGLMMITYTIMAIMLLFLAPFLPLCTP